MIAIYASIILGAIAVLQAGLNRQVTSHVGLSSAVLLNTLVLLVVSVVFLFLSHRFAESLPAQFSPKEFSFKAWWYIIPGVCGFLLVAGIPWAISRSGALTAFLCLVIGQMVASLIWDHFYESISFSLWRVLGAVLAITGLIISTIKR